MKKKITLLLLTLVLIFLAYNLRQSWFARYEVIELPVLPEYVESSGSLINNQGCVLVGCSRPNPQATSYMDDTKGVDALWSPDREMAVIPDMFHTQALNDLNQIAGTVG
ncbi:MAG: hypothetical protein KC978_18210, partial [Candidatus Omnitrophica bacterium]|nr:hypothetical protein [Candidatus Omnitrophota bacterium]